MRLLAELVPQVPAVGHRRGFPPARPRRPRPHGGQAGRRAFRRSAPARRHLPCPGAGAGVAAGGRADRSEEHTSELQSLMRISYAVFCLKKKTITATHLMI